LTSIFTLSSIIYRIRNREHGVHDCEGPVRPPDSRDGTASSEDVDNDQEKGPLRSLNCKRHSPFEFEWSQEQQHEKYEEEY
jgi:hypothetical protein